MSSSTIVPILKQDPNSLFVVLLDMQVPLAPVATKPNTAAAGAAIDRVKGNATGDLGAVVRELTALDDRALALEMVAGEIHASRLQLALIDSESFTDLVRTGLMDRAHERARRDRLGRPASPVLGTTERQAREIRRNPSVRGRTHAV